MILKGTQAVLAQEYLAHPNNPTPKTMTSELIFIVLQW